MFDLRHHGFHHWHCRSVGISMDSQLAVRKGPTNSVLRGSRFKVFVSTNTGTLRLLLTCICWPVSTGSENGTVCQTRDINGMTAKNVMRQGTTERHQGRDCENRHETRRTKRHQGHVPPTSVTREDIPRLQLTKLFALPSPLSTRFNSGCC